MVTVHVWQLVALLVLMGLLMAGALYAFGAMLIWRKRYRRLLSDHIRTIERRANV